MAIDKLAMWQGRMGLCDYCGLEMKPTDRDCHIHHGLIFRNQLPRPKQHTEVGSIDEQINLFLVHSGDCHDALQSDREWAMEFKAAQHGQAAVDDFLARLLPKTYGLRGVKG